MAGNKWLMRNGASITFGRGGKSRYLATEAYRSALNGGRVLYVSRKGNVLLTPVIEEDGAPGVRLQAVDNDGRPRD